MTPSPPGTAGYAEEAAGLVERYESIPFADKYRAVAHLLPGAACRVLDIGAGTGADAAWFASRGHSVVAVEPTDELRLPGMALHRSPLIEWIDDSLPALVATLSSGWRFHRVLMTAVWMHLDEPERRLAMPNVASLLANGGLLILSLRRGPPPAKRRMFDVPAEETIQLARSQGLRCVLNVEAASAQPVNRQAGIRWTWLAFERATNE